MENNNNIVKDIDYSENETYCSWTINIVDKNKVNPWKYNLVRDELICHVAKYINDKFKEIDPDNYDSGNVKVSYDVRSVNCPIMIIVHKNTKISDIKMQIEIVKNALKEAEETTYDEK